MCKDALQSSDPGTVARVGKAYAASIIALLGVPVLLIGGITLLVVASVQRNRRSPSVRH